MPRPDAISFDLFDTIVDLRREDLPVLDVGHGPIRSTAGALWEVVRPVRDFNLPAFVEALRLSDKAFLHARWAEGLEVRTEERFQAFLDSVDLETDGLVDELTAVHTGWIARIASTPPHHRAELERLAEHHRLALCSNFSHTPTAMAILEREGLRDLFDVIVISADLGVRKPRREIFEHTLGALGTEPERTWHVGDQLAKDVAGPAPVGLETVWITRRVADPVAKRASYDGPSPTHVVEDLREIRPLDA